MADGDLEATEMAMSCDKIGKYTHYHVGASPDQFVIEESRPEANWGLEMPLYKLQSLELTS